MSYSLRKLRHAAVAGLAGLTGGAAALSMLAVPAYGAISGSVTAASSPNVVAGQTAQAAGNLTLALTNSTAIGDTITFVVKDNDGVTCAAVGDTIGFNGTPTVTSVPTTTGATAETFSVATSSSSPACTALGVKDQLTLTATNTSTSAQTVTISAIKYDVGAAVAAGGVTVSATGATPPGAGVALTGSPVSNANVVLATSTANTPPTAINPSAPAQSVSNIVITEAQAGAVNGNVCVSITSPTGAGAPTFTPSSTPTVTAGGNGATVNNGAGGTTGTSSPVTKTASTLTFTVATPSTAPTTFTLSGIKLDTGTATGPVTVSVGNGGCGSTNYGANLVITSIIAVNRLAGADRYGTAAAIFSASFNCNTTTVLARGNLFPDALAANYLAGSLNTGTLLTATDQLPAVTVEALRTNGVRNIFIVGGTAAISQAVQDQLTNTPQYNCGGATQRVSNGIVQKMQVTRIGGDTRYDTAQLVAQSPNANLIGTADLDGDTFVNPARTAVVASGENFPDALAAGPMSYAGSAAPNGYSCGKFVATPFSGGACNGFPMLLTATAGLSKQASDGLANLAIKNVIVVGGPNAVSTAVTDALTAAGYNVKRIGGVDRTDTAAQIALFEVGTYSDMPTGTAACNPGGTPATCTKPVGLFYRNDHVNVARGDDFPDALTGGPHAGNEPLGTRCCFFAKGPAPILLSASPDSLGTATTNYLSSHTVSKVPTAGPNPEGGITTVDIFGGPVAITPANATAIQNTLNS